MYITKDFKENKIKLLINIVRADEALATLIENGYDVSEIKTTIDCLKYQGVECERKYTGFEDYSIFEEFGIIIEEICNEIKNNDMNVYFYKKYGY